ncbi:MAG: D-sedoheptulose 7-phosphate isomerase [Patescibacteria group bacterium]
MTENNSLNESASVMAAVAKQCTESVAKAAEALARSLKAGGTAYFCGNGGSAADAQHLAAELAGRFNVERPALAGIALTTNTSSITAIGNDYGYEFVFSRQLEGLGKKGDVLVAITTSGNSKNILEVIKAARKLGLFVIGMTGERGAAFAKLCDIALVTPSDKTPRIQEGHIAMGHAMCEVAERMLYGSK